MGTSQPSREYERQKKTLTLNGVELLGDSGSVVLELLKESGGNGKEVNTSKSLDLSSLPGAMA